jgi:hypothetical protein
MLIWDTGGNVFGGFTPLQLESRAWNGKDNCWKCDDSLKSFLFTLKNPHNIPARKFALMAEKTQKAISCLSLRGPAFGHNNGLWIYDNCNANTDSYTVLLDAHTNDAGLDHFAVFTVSFYLQVREIEVFEITD